MRTYIDPKVTTVEFPTDKINYFTWLKSRQWIIKDEEGNEFMKTMFPNPWWYDELPSKFYVGSELVDKEAYLHRIESMNLQYNNIGSYIFEIDSSCLFRDILFNLNKIGQWAQSNRFLFSILDKNAIYDESNYHISSEYKDKIDWEVQFDNYMKAIKNDPIVDHNRLEMPYSISSTYWISINYKTLIDILTFLKLRSPFFYNVYGKLFLEAADLDESKLGNSVPASISQYILKDKENWREGVQVINGTYIINSYMGLILYSQFIRQADTRICGIYNEIIHDDPKEFENKVFKGGTIIPIHFVADEDRVKSTIRTRLCAFAMSSGDDPCSWNYILNNFIPSNIKLEDFMKLLPCTFKNKKLVNCKFHDDIKFRNEGKELSNCPCPLVSLSMEDAKNKKDRDKNLIGDLFYRLTEYLNNDGLTNHIRGYFWTSNLDIYTDKKLDDVGDLYNIESYLNAIKQLYSIFKDNDSILHIPIQNYSEDGLYKKFDDYYIKYGHDGDYTCMLKGLALDNLIQYLEYSGCERYLINFGGDIFAKNVKSTIDINGTKFSIKADGIYSIFTSGNTEKRGNHIIGGKPNTQSTILVKWYSMNDIDNTLVDALATKVIAQEHSIVNEICNSLDLSASLIYSFDFEDGLLTNKVYCASPFFDDEQIRIRDKMISMMKNYFRPDLTESSEKFENGDNSASKDIVIENEENIVDCDYLVFPKRTSDLGTLYEAGFALGKGKVIIIYDEEKDNYIIYSPDKINYQSKFDGLSSYIFDCSNKKEVVSLGFMSAKAWGDIYYELKGCRDNLMLSENFIHVEKDENGNYQQIIRDPNERDTRPL